MAESWGRERMSITASRVEEMARDLGQQLGRTEEYQALRLAASALDEDRELVALRNDLDRLEGEIMTLLRQGTEPDAALRDRYEALAQDLQLRPGYQRLVVAQTNFDKVLQRVNETISRGIQEGSTSRIILP